MEGKLQSHFWSIISQLTNPFEVHLFGPSIPCVNIAKQTGKKKYMKGGANLLRQFLSRRIPSVGCDKRCKHDDWRSTLEQHWSRVEKPLGWTKMTTNRFVLFSASRDYYYCCCYSESCHSDGAVAPTLVYSLARAYLHGDEERRPRRRCLPLSSLLQPGPEYGSDVVECHSTRK